MPKNVLGETDDGPNGSRRKNCATQKKMVKKLNKRSKEAYAVPQALEVVAARVAHLLKSGEYLFSLELNLGTFTCCEKKLSGGKQVVVGHFTRKGLHLSTLKNGKISVNVGITGLRRFY